MQKPMHGKNAYDPDTIDVLIPYGRFKFLKVVLIEIFMIRIIFQTISMFRKFSTFANDLILFYSEFLKYSV